MRLGWVDGRVVILGALASLLLRGVDGLNLYRYVRNNPVNLVDPDGMSPDPPPDCPDCPKYTYSWNSGGASVSTVQSTESSSVRVTIPNTGLYPIQLEDGTTILSSVSPENIPVVTAPRKPQPSNWNRFWGVVQLIGSVAETVTGALIAVGTSPSGVGAVAGTAIALHGIDGAVTALEQIYTGLPVRTKTAELISDGLELAGVDPATAQTAGDVTDVAIGLGTGFAKAPAVVNGMAKTNAAGKAIDAGSDVVEGGITGTSKVPNSQLAPLAKGVNPSGGRYNCVGCAEAMYARLEGTNPNAVSKFKDSDLGEELVYDIGEETIKYFEKTAPSAVEDYLKSQRFKKINSLRGKENFMNFKEVREFLEQQPVGTHYLVTAGSFQDGHALNIINTRNGVALVDPQNELFISMQNAGSYVKRIFHGRINLWTK